MAWHKYGAEPTRGYASKRELNRAIELHLLQQQGVIRDLVEQPRYQLIPAHNMEGTHKMERAIYYVADFAYTDVESGRTVVEDVKGFRTPVYRLKRRLMKQLYGIEVVER